MIRARWEPSSLSAGAGFFLFGDGVFEVSASLRLRGVGD